MAASGSREDQTGTGSEAAEGAGLRGASRPAPFSRRRLVRRSVLYHWPMSLAIALGVAAATAVITGALLVGDSMRGSLMALTLQRLGHIDLAVLPGRFFDPQQVAGDLPMADHVSPVILFQRAVVETGSVNAGTLRRSGSVQVVAAGEDFWHLDMTGLRPRQIPEGDQIVLNATAARELGVEVGDLVTVRLPRDQAVPADSPLGRRDAETEGLPRLEVIEILPDQGLARFSLAASQADPLTAFLPRELVAEVLDRPGEVNALLVAAADGADEAAEEALTAALRPGLADFGLRLVPVRRTFTPAQDTVDEESSEQEADEQVIFDYYSLTSDALLLPGPAEEAVLEELGESARPVLTYLANAIERIGADGEVTGSVPYSTLSAIDSAPDLPLDFGAQPRGASESADSEAAVPLVLNDWAADQLGAAPGDALRVYYFEPETSSGREIERSFAAVLTSIVPITEPAQPHRRRRPAVFDEPPTVYNDPDLTPTVPGVTDQDSISDWDLPFTLERTIEAEDDRYWNNHRLTPKAFIPLDDGRRLFGSRFGEATSLRIDAQAAADAQALEPRIVAALQDVAGPLGFAPLPLRRLQEEASRGTVPFDFLFLSLSFFVIIAALMLVALLFRLGMQQRAAEYGTLLAAGMPGRVLSRLALAEGAMVAIPGAMLGVALGVLYARAVLWALGSVWVGAVTTPFLQFHATATSLVVGLVAGVLMAILTIGWTVRRLRRGDVQPLLAGRIPENPGSRRAGRIGRYLTLACFLAAGAALALAAFGLSGQAQGGTFVGGGMLLLIGVLLAVYQYLTGRDRQEDRPALGTAYGLTTMAARVIGRNPLRSTLSIGLMAVACFLIVSMGAFQLQPTEAGVGGFDLMGHTAQPLYRDLGDPAVRAQLLGPDAETLASARLFGWRVRHGQDASCTNLYQASQPTVHGVPTSFAEAMDDDPELPGFAWAAGTLAGGRPPWSRLAEAGDGSEKSPIPMILDQNTAQWSLQMRGGIGEVRGFEFDDGRTLYFRVVGLLSNTILQGSLMVGEQHFQRLFPEISGYQYFLVDLGADAIDPQHREQAARVLENRLGDVGMDVVETRSVLARLLAVQNTYLRTFQSLGALGLLLGTFGLAVVQLRSVLERRGELALLRAVGFSRVRLATLVMLENATLLLAGIGCGVLVALIAVIPYMLLGSAQPGIVEPLGLLAIVTLVGLLAGLLAVRRAVTMPLLGALRD